MAPRREKVPTRRTLRYGKFASTNRRQYHHRCFERDVVLVATMAARLSAREGYSRYDPIHRFGMRRGFVEMHRVVRIFANSKYDCHGSVALPVLEDMSKVVTTTDALEVDFINHLRCFYENRLVAHFALGSRRAACPRRLLQPIPWK